MRNFATLIPFAIAISLTSCVGTIDKALYSIAESVTEKDRITGLRSLSFQNREQQIQEGDAFAASFLKKYGDNINEKVSSSQYRRLKKVFERVHKVSHFRNEKWTVVLLPDKDFQAFVTGGTYVFANLGFMEFCSDAEVAAVIGHEIGHITANHPFEGNSYLLAATLAGAKNLKKEGYAEGFSRNQEAEADKIGIMYMALAGFNPEKSSGFWKRLTDGQASMTRTHPMHEQRARNNANLARQVWQYYTPGKINPDFEKLLVRNVLWDASGGEVEAGKGGGLLATLSAAVDTATKHYGAKSEREDMRRRVEASGGQTQAGHAQAELISAASQVVRQIGQAQISPDGQTMTATFRYSGGKQLRNIQFESQITLAGYKPLISRSNSGGPINPGMSFLVQFADSTLANYAPYLKSGQAGLSFRIIGVQL